VLPKTRDLLETQHQGLVQNSTSLKSPVLFIFMLID